MGGASWGGGEVNRRRFSWGEWGKGWRTWGDGVPRPAGLRAGWMRSETAASWGGSGGPGGCSRPTREPVLDFKSLCDIGKTGDQGRSDRRCTAGPTSDQGRSDRPHVAGLTGDPVRGCEACQRFGNVQLVPATVLNPIIKPWPFRGWALDFVGQIYPSSSRGHRFVLVATDYFTKWAEAVPLKNMTHTKANGQTESSNKTLLKLVKKKIEEHPKRWYEVLSEALWAHRISKHGATKVTPFELVYGQEVVLPVEVNLSSLRYIKQDDLSSEDYKTLMGDNLDGVIDERLRALEEIEKEKKRVAKAYNKRVKAKLFQIGDLVWKTILPLGTRSKEFGKWSPSWEGPYQVCGIVRGNAYFLETLQGERFQRAINGKYLKKYFPSVWQDT
uniref:Putative integrase n=1 Tax=Oryza sativa subsp. japonica TaxID=39947 RepID=Q6UUB9_ORYSJ|nr:putative integrase [Oryza sativa Japonica Group]